MLFFFFAYLKNIIINSCLLNSLITVTNAKKPPDVIRDLLGTNISHLWFSNTTVSRIDINNFLYINTIPTDILKMWFNSWKIFRFFCPLFVSLFIKATHLAGKQRHKLYACVHRLQISPHWAFSYNLSL